VSKPIFLEILAGAIRKWGQSSSRLEPQLDDSEVLTASINHTAIDRLSAVNPTLIQRLIPLFLNDEAPKLLAAIGKSLQIGDAVTISDAAHNLKGTCHALGAVKLAQLCQQVETKSGCGDLQGIDRLLQQTELEYQIVHRELSKLLPPDSLN
jgi:HPt (histidine-containing phosphotransfer) domain-containing protein